MRPDEVLHFLRDPAGFARTPAPARSLIWSAALKWAQGTIDRTGGHGLRDAQVKAWEGLSALRAALILGPPGTGKTFALSWMTLAFAEQSRTAGLPCRVLLTAFTRNAIGNLLDAIAGQARIAGVKPRLAFVGSAPPAGVHENVELFDDASSGEVIEALQGENIIVGASTWSLQKLVQAANGKGSSDLTAPLFELVCIDEASQMALAQGLLAVCGLSDDGSVLVAGDNKQLQPIGGLHDFEFEGRKLGTSLYDYLVAQEVPEFPFDETFRLNRPLVHFPERRFYPERYRSAVPETRLELVDGWREGLEPWETIALNPEYPVCILLHEGPACGTSNPFEAHLVGKLVERFRHRMVPATGQLELTEEVFWSKRLAVVSPHRAQNAAIKAELRAKGAGKDCVVETVDRIQGKERDTIIASYTVSDPEFALAESEFLFSRERLNVMITRAKTKLILVVSRRLLEVIPTSEEVFDAAQTLQEFVLSSDELITGTLRDERGFSFSVAIRVRRFDDGELPSFVGGLETPEPSSPLPERTPELERLLDAIRTVAAQNPYGTAKEKELRNRLRRPVHFEELRALARLGAVALDVKSSSFGPFLVIRPLETERVPFPVDEASVRARIDEAIDGARKFARAAPLYAIVRQRFDWMHEKLEDALKPLVDALVAEGILVWGTSKGGETLDRADRRSVDATPSAPPPDPPEDADFRVLNKLEDLEARRINFGVFEGWTTPKELGRAARVSDEVLKTSLTRLRQHGHVLVEEGRIRSRMAELAREVRYVKQRFDKGDSEKRPFLVRSLKVHVLDRDKPTRDQQLGSVLDGLKAALPEVDALDAVLSGLDGMLRNAWKTSTVMLAGFQARALQTILPAWLGQSSDDAFVITADTGSGKTEAALLPMIAGALLDSLAGVKGTRAVLVYPRIRLGANQAQRLTEYLAALGEQRGLPALTIGLQNKDVPGSFSKLEGDMAQLWARKGPGYLFPFFDCPACSGQLVLIPSGGASNCDALTCESSACGWKFGGWVGSKAGLVRTPPHFFLPVTESLHQWLQNPRYGALFGDVEGLSPPRAILADEIHLYSHIHGAQVGHTLQRILLRAQMNGPNHGLRPLAVGMSATLGNPKAVWGTLVDRSAKEIRVAQTVVERLPNVRAREYFYFVQPEVESRGQDIAGASTTIQALMCLSHGMRRRTGDDGGYRGIVFFDSIDKLKRLHGQYIDAEEGRRLASLRTYLYDDDATTGEPKRSCCSEPTKCDAFKQGECWYHAATDEHQWTARGPYQRGFPLTVCPKPIFSGTSGRVDALLRRSDLVFSTSSLEVGYDDSEMMLVYQHYAPVNLASFIQRKGRGGRGSDDRPVTGVTLSLYSPRDSYYFRRPERMLDASGFEVPLNMQNHFVVRGQLLSLFLDVAAWNRVSASDPFALPDRQFEDAERLAGHMLGPAVLRRLGYRSMRELWSAAWSVAHPLPGTASSPRDWADHLPWVPRTLFATINLPVLSVTFDDDSGQPAKPRAEDISLALSICAPGNVTRQYGNEMLHWVPPRQGDAPLVSADEYTRDDRYFFVPDAPSAEALLSRLPEEARVRLGPDVDTRVFRPQRLALECAGYMRGGGWTPCWAYDPRLAKVEKLLARPEERQVAGAKVRAESRGVLVGFSLVSAAQQMARGIHASSLPKALSAGVHVFLSQSGNEDRTGLSVARVFWGAEAELSLDDKKTSDASLSQRFVHPTSKRPLLHGYDVETEGIRMRINSDLLDLAVQAELTRPREDPERKYLGSQFFRYLVESRTTELGLHPFDSRRLAELVVSAAADPTDREVLAGLRREWSSTRLRKLLLDVFHDRLRHHPQLTEARVEQTCGKLGSARTQKAFTTILQDVADKQRFKAYLRSVLLHGLAIRLKQAFVLHGRGDERRVRFHVLLPLQLGASQEDILYVYEDGNHGDGTTRSFRAHIEEAFEGWGTGALAGCPNAAEDALLERAFARPELHETWRELDPGRMDTIDRLAADLGLGDDGRASLQGLMRVFYGTETVGAERYSLYELHGEIKATRRVLENRFGRSPTEWELVSTVVRLASEGHEDVPAHTGLLKSYASLEDAENEDSLDPTRRLADQVYRLSAALCVDGCPACVHVGSDLMSDSMARASNSRRLLERFEALLAQGASTSPST